MTKVYYLNAAEKGKVSNLVAQSNGSKYKDWKDRNTTTEMKKFIGMNEKE